MLQEPAPVREHEMGEKERRIHLGMNVNKQIHEERGMFFVSLLLGGRER